MPIRDWQADTICTTPERAFAAIDNLPLKGLSAPLSDYE
jgi:hypothetical protein